MGNRAGLKHVRGVRPNRAADFRGAPFWTLKRTRNTATRYLLRAYNAAKCDCCGATPRTPLGKRMYSAPPDFLAGFKGAASRRRGGRGKGSKGGEGKGRGEEQGGAEGEGRLTRMRSWNRAADWLRPALMGTTVSWLFTRAGLCDSDVSVRPSVCLSVCPSVCHTLVL